MHAIIDIDPSYPLDNDRHEQFAFRYALIGNAAEAYYQIYGGDRDNTNRLGSLLLSKVDVRKRVDFIQQAQTDAAFATITRNLNAKKVIVHDSDAVLTEVNDPQSQIAAATAILKANGRIQSGPTATGTITNNYNLVAVTQSIGFGDAADKVIAMNNALMARRAGHNVIDVKASAENTQSNLT